MDVGLRESSVAGTLPLEAVEVWREGGGRGGGEEGEGREGGGEGREGKRGGREGEGGGGREEGERGRERECLKNGGKGKRRKEGSTCMSLSLVDHLHVMHCTCSCCMYMIK